MKLLRLFLIIVLLTSPTTFGMNESAASKPHITGLVKVHNVIIPNKKNVSKKIRRIFNNHDGLRPKNIKEIILSFYIDRPIVLKTPESLPCYAGLSSWKPHYPPIKSLRFRARNILEATAPGTKHGYNFVICWNVDDGSCTVEHTGYNDHQSISLREYKMEHKSSGKDPVPDSSCALHAKVITLCPVETLPRREPMLIYRSDHRVQLTPIVNPLQSILLGEPCQATQKSKSE